MKLRKIGPKIDLNQINEIEIKLNVEFPPVYKDFLILNNGGYVDGFLVTPPFWEVNPESKNEYKQTSSPEYFYNINEILEEYEDNIDDPVIPDKYISIAYDSTGNKILLCLDNSESHGKVYFANHELYYSDTGFWVLTKISDNFSTFIDELHEFDE